MQGLEELLGQARWLCDFWSFPAVRESGSHNEQMDGLQGSLGFLG